MALAPDHILGGGADEVHFYTSGFKLPDGFGSPKGGGGPTHVNFHHFDAAASPFDVETARVKGETLTDNGQLTAGGALGL
jgi:hypothetical protein